MKNKLLCFLIASVFAAFPASGKYYHYSGKKGSGGGGGGGAWGSITGTLSDQSDLASALALKAPLNSPTLVTPNLGIPSFITLTNATGLPISGLTGLASGIATFLATPTSANLATAITNETGSGALVFATSPTLVTPALGTPSALVGTNITGIASGLTAGNVTTNANMNGDVTSVGNTTTIAANAVTNAKMSTMVTATIKGNVSGSTAVPSDLTAVQLQILARDVNKQLSSTSAYQLLSTDSPEVQFVASAGDVPAKLPDNSGGAFNGLIRCFTQFSQTSSNAGEVQSPAGAHLSYLRHAGVRKCYLGASSTWAQIKLDPTDAFDTGLIPIPNIASGTPDGTKFVADDGTLKTPTASASLTSTQVGFGNGSNVLSGSTALTFDNTNKALILNGGNSVASYLKGYQGTFTGTTLATDGWNFGYMTGGSAVLTAQNLEGGINVRNNRTGSIGGLSVGADSSGTETLLLGPHGIGQISIWDGNYIYFTDYPAMLDNGVGFGSPINASSNSTVAKVDGVAHNMDATSGAKTFSLPNVTTDGTNRLLWAFKKVDSSTNAVSIAPNGAQNIDGANVSNVLNTPQASRLMLAEDSGGTKIIAEYQPVTGSTKPTCDVNMKGRPWTTPGGAGVADVYQVCLKDAADAYAWVTK